MTIVKPQYVAWVALLVVFGCKSERSAETAETDIQQKPTAVERKHLSDDELDTMFSKCSKKGEACAEYAEAASFACGNNAAACGGYALLVHYIGVTGKVDVKAAQEAMIRGCDVGKHKAICTTERILFADANLQDPSIVQFQSTFEKACANGNMTACSNLSFLLYRSGTEVDLARSAELSVRGCQANNGTACAVESIHAIASKNMKRARALSERACELADGQSCFNAAIMADRGEGGPRDQARASELGAMACEHGLETACTRLDRIAPWMGAKSNASATIVEFERNNSGSEQTKVDSVGGKMISLSVKKKRKLTVIARYADKDYPLGDFPRLSSVEALVADGHLYVHIYDVRRDGKILATDGFKLRIGPDSLEPAAKARTKSGRLDYRKANYEAL
jgi:TPR repeat protein